MLSTAQWIGMGILTSIFSTWGDLCESLLKRTAGVKDSGKILPGHGGILDRFDSELIASPVIFIYLTFVLYPRCLHRLLFYIKFVIIQISAYERPTL